MKRILFSILLFSLFSNNIFGQEEENSPLFLLPFGYDFVRFENQTIHKPAIGAGLMLGDMDTPFDQVDRRIFALALWRPFIFSQPPYPEASNLLHNIEAIVDWRIERHQLLFILNSAAEKPIIGGLNTFQTGFGWGYEILRRPNLSLILGITLAVGDFSEYLPFEFEGVWPLLPLPFVRFGIDTQWFDLFFDFLTGPNLKFTIAPEERIRFTADMRMDYYRSIIDINCEYILWYRLFPEEHRLGDFAGIGLGFKNESEGFLLSSKSATGNAVNTFEIQKASVFAVLDLSLLKLEGGWIFNSRYMMNEQRTGSPGRGFYLSVQGIIPLGKIN